MIKYVAREGIKTVIEKTTETVKYFSNSIRAVLLTEQNTFYLCFLTCVAASENSSSVCCDASSLTRSAITSRLSSIQSLVTTSGSVTMSASPSSISVTEVSQHSAISQACRILKHRHHLTHQRIITGSDQRIDDSARRDTHLLRSRRKSSSACNASLVRVRSASKCNMALQAFIISVHSSFSVCQTMTSHVNKKRCNGQRL